MTYTSPLLGLADAVAAEGLDAGVAAHFGEPLPEQRRAVEGVGVTDRSHRSIVRVGGADRLTWLHSLMSQHLSELASGTATEALVLSPHGHVEHHVHVVDDGEATWLTGEPGTGAALTEFLRSMQFMLRVEPVEVSDEYAVLSTTQPLADVEGVVVAGPDIVVPRSDLVARWEQLVEAGASPLGVWGWEALRVAAVQPRLGIDTDHRTIPHEVGWLDTAVHLDKGCYRGQETVARVHNLGRPPRRLVLLHLDGSDVHLPPTGTPVTWEGAQVGLLGTVARHYELGSIALAVIRRNTPVDAPLLTGDVPASIDPESYVVDARRQRPGAQLLR